MDELKPYSLHWRPNLVTRWMRLRDLDEHPGDLEEFVRAYKELVDRNLYVAGQWRLVSQHVIEETGILSQ